MHIVSDTSFHQLIKIMEEFLAMSVKFKTTLRSVLQETTYEKGSRILNFGQTQHLVWFMLTGLAREIKVDEHTYKEKTSWFWPFWSFLYTNPGFFSQDLSERTIEILEQSSMVFITYPDWKMLRENFKEAEIITEKVRRMNERARIEHLENIKYISTDDRYLMQQHTLEDLFTRTKLKYIAEYMGMAPDTLGKLRKKYAGRR